jgi:hypothetical protein
LSRGRLHERGTEVRVPGRVRVMGEREGSAEWRKWCADKREIPR